MLQNLSKYKEQLKQKDELLQKEKPITSMQEGKAQPQIKQKASIPLSIECMVLDSVLVPNDPQSIQKQKEQLQEGISSTNHLNHPLMLQYIAIATQHEVQLNRGEAQKKDKKQNLQKNGKNNNNPKESAGNKAKENETKQPKQKKSESQSKPKEQVKQQQNPNNKVKEKLTDVNSKQQVKSQVDLLILVAGSIDKLSLLKFKNEPKSKQEIKLRISLLSQITQAICYMHQHQMSFYPHNLEDVLFTTKTSHIKLATHKFKHWKATTPAQIQQLKQKQMTKIKKDVLANRSVKFISPEFLFKDITITDIRMNDVWKLGLIIFTVLSGQDFSKELFALQSLNQSKINQYSVLPAQKLAKIKKFLKEQQINQLLGSVAMIPQKRITASKALAVMSQFQETFGQQFSQQTKDNAKAYYLKEESAKLVRFNKELKPNQELITNDNKKKLAEYFKLSQNGRIVKNYELIFKGSESKFSSRCFYQAVLQKKSMLLVVLEKKEKKKILCYSQQDFDLKKCNGVFGGFIRDFKKLSFMYSPAENEFLRLKNSEKAIGVSMIQGPIIGDGDLVIYDGAVCNSCRFPSSYESATNKVKKLFKSEKFQVEQYEVYQLTFDSK